LGSVWAPTNYAIIRGLHRYQKKELAAKLAKQYYWCVAQVFERTKTFWENYAPDQLTKGNWARPDFCGWTAIVPITLLRELIQV
jgi:neutral trehalase